MRIWFTADTHFNHSNVIKYSKRPFADLEDMTETLIASWNTTVGPGDCVYHLGDFALSWGQKHAFYINGLISGLNGTKFLVVGNHDREEVTKCPRWSKVAHYHELKVDLGGIHKQRIVLCHYAMRVWNGMHRGAWMLHGHSHGNLTDIGGRILDVGVDCHNFKPIGLDQVREYMSTREFINQDHHEEKAE